jgi:hypothetical protein
MTSSPAATAGEQKAARKGHVGARRAQVAPKKEKSTKKAKAPRKTTKAAEQAGAARDGSKIAKVLDLLKLPDGAALVELMKATGRQAHNVRGFISGTLSNKMDLTVVSTKGPDGVRSYCIKA